MAVREETRPVIFELPVDSEPERSKTFFFKKYLSLMLEGRMTLGRKGPPVEEKWATSHSQEGSLPASDVPFSSTKEKLPPKFRALLERHLRQPPPSVLDRLRGMEVQDRGPNLAEKLHLGQILAGLNRQQVVKEQLSSRGFLVKFGDWRPAPPRESGSGFWARDDVLLRTSERKRYFRSKWRQEYTWCESTRQYLCRGYWATGAFRDPSFILDNFSPVKLLSGRWYTGSDNFACLLNGLTVAPPEIGLQPVLRALTLSYVQCHYWTRSGEPKTQGRCQLRFNVDIGEA